MLRTVGPFLSSNGRVPENLIEMTFLNQRSYLLMAHADAPTILIMENVKVVLGKLFDVLIDCWNDTQLGEDEDGLSVALSLDP